MANIYRKPCKKRPNQGMRNLRSAGYSVAKFTGRTSEKAVVGLFKRATTDHLGMNDALGRMPKMGLLYTLHYIAVIFMIQVAYAILGGIWIFLLVAYGIPYLITGSFKPLIAE